METQLTSLLDREQVFVKHRLQSKAIYNIQDVSYEFDQTFIAPDGTPPEEWGERNEYQFLRVCDRVRLLLNENQMDLLFLNRQFKAALPGNRKPQPVPPDGPEDPEAPRRQFWCQRYDEVMPWNSQVSMDRFVEDIKERFKENAEFKHLVIDPPDAWSVRRWAHERGHVGWRPLFLMGRKDAGTRRHFPQRVEQMLRTALAWYWSELARNRRNAHDRLKVVIPYLNKRAQRQGGSGLVLPLPSYQTFCRRVQGDERRQTWAAKYGERAATARFDGVSELPAASRILHVVMIDSTTADTHLVLGPKLIPMGRPTVNFVIDLYSRAILAIFVTFDGPNLHVAMATLKRALLPKLDLIAQYPDKKITLEPYGTPAIVVVDNAWAQVGQAYLDACADLNMDLRFAPIATPQAKAHVERFIGTISRLVFHKAPGGIPYDPRVLKALDFDPATTAILDIAELQERLVDAVHAYHLDLHDGIGVAPIVKWRAGAVIHGIEACSDPDHIDAAAGEVGEATLTREGVKYKGRVYHDKRVVSHLLERLAPLDPLHSKRRSTVRARVKFKRIPGDLTAMSIWNHRDKEYVTLPARHAIFLTGMSESQYENIKAMAALANLPFDTEVECAKARTILIRRLEAAHPERRMDAARKQQRLLLADQPGVIFGSMVRVLTAPARHDGQAPVEDEAGVHVPIDVGARAGRAAPVKGIRRGGAAATKKAQKTKTSKALAAAEAAQTAAENAAGFSPVPPDLLTANSPLYRPVEIALPEKVSTERQAASGGNRRAEIMAKIQKAPGWGKGSTGPEKETENGHD
jgi:putative transposase